MMTPSCTIAMSMVYNKMEKMDKNDELKSYIKKISDVL